MLRNILLILFLPGHYAERAMTYKASCAMRGEARINFFFLQRNTGPVTLYGFIRKVPQLSSIHGITIHTTGDVTKNCTKVGDHWNPYGKKHGSPHIENRHTGDLGNIDLRGTNYVEEVDHMISLSGPMSIVGRTLVLHKYEDNFGLGLGNSSAKTGNSGPAIACCVIGWMEIKRVMLVDPSGGRRSTIRLLTSQQLCIFVFFGAKIFS